MATGAKRWVRSLAPAQMGGQDIYHPACEAWWDPERKNCSPENPSGQGDRGIGAPPILTTRADSREIIIAGTKDGMLYALDPDAAGAVLSDPPNAPSADRPPARGSRECAYRAGCRCNRS